RPVSGSPAEALRVEEEGVDVCDVTLWIHDQPCPNGVSRNRGRKPRHYWPPTRRPLKRSVEPRSGQTTTQRQQYHHSLILGRHRQPGEYSQPRRAPDGQSGVHDFGEDRQTDAAPEKSRRVEVTGAAVIEHQIVEHRE